MLEDQLARAVRGVAADVLLDVGVLVVVDPDHLVAGDGGQVCHEAGLADAGVALHQHGVVAQRHDAGEVGQVLLHGRRHDVVRLGAGLARTSPHPEPGHAHAAGRPLARLLGLEDGLLQEAVRLLGPRHVLDDEVPHRGVAAAVQLSQEGEAECFVQASLHRATRVAASNFQGPAVKRVYLLFTAMVFVDKMIDITFMLITN